MSFCIRMVTSAMRASILSEFISKDCLLLVWVVALCSRDFLSRNLQLPCRPMRQMSQSPVRAISLVLCLYWTEISSNLGNLNLKGKGGRVIENPSLLKSVLKRGE